MVRYSSVCLIALVCLLSALIATVLGNDDMNGPPVRPKVFKSPGELRQYLKALNEYFAIVGRPRFGKRTMEDGFSKRTTDYSKFDLDGNGSITIPERDYLRYLLYGYKK